MSMSQPPETEGLRDAAQRKLSLLQTIKAVAWSFFGVRRGSDYQNDVNKLNPVHVIIAGLIGAALFIIALILLVRLVVTSGAAS
ncbi:conserved hypothetical protein [Leptothrix cholodnii SP-6]|uniref:Transmembrane protein n=1 Tax=Leptothrix cholodnii (strain ATCC 51168 / LMG 8142 / SP-6) TaxID=395495 RepID=B1Y6P8_LEPCP|nr:DUF2970 domain-containing protein [Leptothrix cholodnii]ACB36076.1 conserved hypothetical protein [Leptothrix cholodnii SP-6]